MRRRSSPGRELPGLLPALHSCREARAHWYSAAVAVLQAFNHTSTEAECLAVSCGDGRCGLGKEGRPSVTSLL